MNSYLLLLCYILLGFAGGAWHYIKQRYVSKSIKLGFIEYLQSDLEATIKATFAIISAEYALASIDTDGIIAMNEFVGALTAGYAANSHLNKCAEKDNCANTMEVK